MSAVRLERVAHRFGSTVRAVDDVSLALERGEFLCLLGPSGCGKTTLLRLLGGYVPCQQGAIFIDDRDVTREPPERRRVGMVFQSYALFPHLNARDNVAFGLRAKGVARTERSARVESLLDWVGLAPAERERRPRDLSGGQQQRVALARALAIEPAVLTLDEPFANLDRQLRERLREEVRVIQRKAGVATILVTHDQEEALALADRLAVMDRGHILQVGPPEEVYGRPASEAVARFLGEANVLTVEAVSAESVTLAGGLRVARVELPTATPGARVLVRPERLVLAGESGTKASVTSRSYLGSEVVLTLDAAGTELRVRVRAGEAAAPGDVTSVGVSPGAAWLLPDAESSRG